MASERESLEAQARYSDLRFQRLFDDRPIGESSGNFAERTRRYMGRLATFVRLTVAEYRLDAKIRDWDRQNPHESIQRVQSTDPGVPRATYQPDCE